MSILVHPAGPASPGLGSVDKARSLSPTLGQAPSVAVRARFHAGVVLMAIDLVAAIALVGTVALNATTTTAVLSVSAVALSWVLLLVLARAYDNTPGLGVSSQATGVLRAGAALGLLCWIAPALADVAVPAERLILLTGALTLAALVSHAADAGWSARRVAAAGGVPLVVAGDVEDVARTVAELRRVGNRRWRVVAARVPVQPIGVDVGAPVDVGMEDLAEVVVTSGAEGVLLLPGHQLDPHRLRRLTWQLEATGVPLFVGTGLLDAAPARTRMLAVGDLDLVHVRPASMRRPALLLKSVIELMGAAALIVVLAPLLVAVAVAVRLDSPGPALFRQRRVGRDGKDFTMYKFRTMSTHAESDLADLADCNEVEGQVLFKIRQDPRLTRVGGFLRRYSLDELPQLFNVLVGTMSLIGPRPALPTEVAAYDLDPRRRLAVKPGLTGLWQVSGRSDLSWEDTVRLDLHYVDNWTLALDASILCRTVRAVLGHRGAY